MTIPILKLGVNNYCNGSEECKTGKCHCDATAVSEIANKLNYRLGDKIVAISTIEGVKQSPVIKILGGNLSCIVNQLYGKCLLGVERADLVLLTETEPGTVRTIFRVRREDRQIHVVHNYLTKIQRGFPLSRKELGDTCSPLGSLARDCVNI